MRRALLLVVLLGAILGAGCSASKKLEVSKTPLPPTDLRGQKQVEIDARSDQFTPDDIIVTLGTEVTWKNLDTVAHNVKKSADVLDFGAPFGTDVFNPGQAYSFTFAKVGTFTYTCTIHAGMDGTVQVVAR